MTILSQTIGHYSQTIKVGRRIEVEVSLEGKQLYKGEATNIIDLHNKLSFKDNLGKQYEFTKREQVTFS